MGEPPIEILDMSNARLTVHSGVDDRDAHSPFAERGCQDVLPGLALGNETLIGRATADSENIDLARRAVASTKPECVPLVHDGLAPVVVELADIEAKRAAPDQMEPVHQVLREPVSETELEHQSSQKRSR